MICLDELGPLAVKTYPGADYVPHERRATSEPDYGRRGVVWAHGACEPATGQAALVLTGRRDAASHIQLLEHVVTEFPSQRLILIEDNLSAHHSRDVQAALLAWPEVAVQFIPKYASWLNLIEPWWKVLRSLALKGRRFETADDLKAALLAALTYWTAHRHPFHWRKYPQQQPTHVFDGYRTALVPA